MNTIGDCPENVSKIEALGSTPYAYNYCTIGTYIGQYSDLDSGNWWRTAEDESCSHFYTVWFYHLEEDDDVEDYDYDNVYHPRMARFIYNIGLYQHKVEIWCNEIPE